MSVVKSDLSYVCHQYQELFCTTMSRGALSDIKVLMEKGAEPELVILAMEKAVQRGAAWGYAKAIIERCLEEGIFKRETFEYRTEFKRCMKRFRFRFPYHNEDTLLPFVLIEMGREYLAEIEKGIAEMEKDTTPFNIDDYVDKD